MTNKQNADQRDDGLDENRLGVPERNQNPQQVCLITISFYLQVVFVYAWYLSTLTRQQ